MCSSDLDRYYHATTTLRLLSQRKRCCEIMLILRPSVKLAQRLKCRITESPHLPKQQRDSDSWSGDLFARRGAGSHALMMHDATLFSVLVPLDNIRSFEPFVIRFLARVAQTWKRFGSSLDPTNQNLVVMKRTNRSIIGSMNEAKWLLEGDVIQSLEKHGSVDWTDIERQMNEVPYSALSYRRPVDALGTLLAS